MKRLWQIAAMSFAPLVWGTTYLVTTEFLPPGRPLFVGAVRALPAGLVLLAVVAAVAGRRVLPRGEWWWRAAALALLNIGLIFPLLFLSAYRLPGGIAAVIGAIGPFVVAGYAFVLLGERAARRLMVAAVIGVAGVALLVLRSAITLDAIGLAASGAATLIMGLGTVLGRRWGLPDGYRGSVTALLALTGWQLTFGGALILAASFLVEGPPPALTVTNVAAFAHLTLVGTALAYALWFRGVATLPPTLNTLLTLLSPTVAAVLGWVVLGQALSPGQLAGVAAVLFAVLLGTSSPRRGTPSPASRVRPVRGSPAAGPRAEAPPAETPRAEMCDSVAR